MECQLGVKKSTESHGLDFGRFCSRSKVSPINVSFQRVDKIYGWAVVRPWSKSFVARVKRIKWRMALPFGLQNRLILCYASNFVLQEMFLPRSSSVSRSLRSEFAEFQLAVKNLRNRMVSILVVFAQDPKCHSLLNPLSFENWLWFLGLKACPTILTTIVEIHKKIW